MGIRLKRGGVAVFHHLVQLRKKPADIVKEDVKQLCDKSVASHVAQPIKHLRVKNRYLRGSRSRRVSVLARRRRGRCRNGLHGSLNDPKKFCCPDRLGDASIHASVSALLGHLRACISRKGKDGHTRQT